MHKTTVYLPDDLRNALRRTATSRGVSEAQLIREAIAKLTSDSLPPQPELPLIRSGMPDLAEQIDESMPGFGER
ncbi:MAG: CopG family transcriptional regulator [Gammaproteobacteria bacterium]